jgi:hypothetical protein
LEGGTKDEIQIFESEFRLTTIRSPNRKLTPLKSASFEIRISSFVHPSKNSLGRDKRLPSQANILRRPQSSDQDDDGHRWHGDVSIENGDMSIEKVASAMIPHRAFRFAFQNRRLRSMVSHMAFEALFKDMSTGLVRCGEQAFLKMI